MKMFDVIYNQSKFVKTNEWTGKEKKSNITKFFKGLLQRYWRKLKDDELFDGDVYEKFIQLARNHGEFTAFLKLI